MSRDHFETLLVQRLIGNRQIAPEDLDRALELQREAPEASLGEILIRTNVVSREALALAFLQIYPQLDAAAS